MLARGTTQIPVDPFHDPVRPHPFAHIAPAPVLEVGTTLPQLQVKLDESPYVIVPPAAPQSEDDIALCIALHDTPLVLIYGETPQLLHALFTSS